MVTQIFTDGNANAPAVSQHPEEAWSFIKYISSPEVAHYWVAATGAPSIWRSGLESFLELNAAIPGVEYYLSQSDFGRALPFDHTWAAKWNCYSAPAALWNGESSPLETAIQMKQEMEAAMINAN